MKKTLLTLAAATCLAAFSGNAARADVILLGNDTTSPVEQFTPTGTSLGFFGATSATGSAFDGMGHVWTVQPGGSDSVITEYNLAQTPLATIHFTSGIDNGKGFQSWIEDMAYAGGGNLWLSGYNGMVYKINSAGAIINTPFDTGHSYVGIATDGTNLYTTRGIGGGSVIDVRDLSGNILSSITTTVSDMGGIGYQASTHTLWAGTFGNVFQFDLAGNTLSSFATASGAFHDGLEIGNLNGTVPEPSSVVLMGLGVAGVAALRLRKKK